MHRLPALIVLAALSALAAAAWAAARTPLPDYGPGVPRDAQVVAGPTADESVLLAWRRGARLCTAVRGLDRDGYPTSRRDPEYGELVDTIDCRDAPALLPDGHETVEMPWVGVSEFGDGGVMAYGFTGSDVATVRLVGRRAPAVDAATVALPAALGDGRVFLLEAGTAPFTDLQFLDAAGGVRRAEDVLDADFGRPRVRRLVAQGRRGGRWWRLTTYTRRPLEPTPLEPARRVRRPCVAVAVAPGEVAGEACADDLPLVVGQGGICEADLTIIPLVVRSDVHAVEAVLGDGRRQRARLWPLVGAAGLRGGALLIDGDLAVRRVVGRDRQGVVVQRLDLGNPPLRSSCARGVLGWVSLFGSSTDPTPAGPGSHAIVGVDRDDELCLALDASDAEREVCRVPPLDPEEVWPDVLPAADGKIAIALVPAGVDRGTLLLDDGTTIDAAAAPIGGYGGRYAAVTRLLRWDLPRDRRAVGLRQRDARARLLEQGIGPEFPAPRGVAPLLRDGGVILSAGTMPGTAWGWRGGPCITVTSRWSSRCATTQADMLTVDVDCASRRTVISGLLKRPADRLVARLNGGRTVPVRLRQLPQTLGAGAGALLVLAADVGVRQLELRPIRGAVRREAVHFPPAAEQCGYGSWLSLAAPTRRR